MIQWQSHKSLKAFLLFVVPSIVSWYAALWLTVWIRRGYGAEAFLSMAEYFSPVFLLWLLTFYAFRLYDESTYRALERVLKSFVSAFVAMGVLAVVYFYFQPELTVTPRRFLLLLLLLSATLEFFWFLLLYKYAFKRLGRRLVFVSGGADSTPTDLASTLPSGWEYVEVQELSDSFGGGVDERSLVVLARVGTGGQEVKHGYFSFRSRGVMGVSLLRAYEVLHGRVPLQLVDAAWFMEHSDHDSLVYLSVKRLIDIFAGVVLGLVYVVLFPFIFLAIKISSPGPVLFRQERVGLFGKTFTVYKLRTMQVNPGGVWTGNKDPRITKVGQVLRRLSLDELPQAINLLKGDMSLVGPRPEQVGLTKQLREEIPFFEERLVVKPGITGWAQLHVYASNISDSRLKLEYDLYYIKHRSLWFDFSIMLKTAYTLVFGQSR